MSKIALPQKIEYVPGKTTEEGRIIVEPLFPGYGITLGNSIRRVLLSSLPGAAVVGMKIKGADHEFMGLPHVKEDILEIILNIKKLRLKVHSEETVKLELSVKGAKKITAGDIKKDSAVEIANPELEIAEITDQVGTFNAEIFVARGMGYVTVEARETASGGAIGEKKEKEIGYIEIDSIFSPVLSVGIRVENVRVGKMTNWDKLNLDIVTDGTIAPDESFHEAVEVLIEQFKALAKREAPEKAEKEEAKAETDAEEAELTGEESEEEEAAPAAEKEAEEPKRKRGRPRKDAS